MLPSLFFVPSHAHKYMRISYGSYFINFAGSLKLMKMEPPGVLFNLFLDSKNMKISLSTLVSFTLIKENERMSTQYKFTPFTDWVDYLQKKE